MRRRRISNAERLRLFAEAGGICHLCGEPIDQRRQRWDVEHAKPHWLGGADEGDNLKPAHSLCHLRKSAKEAGERAKGNRIKAKHLGIARKRPSFRTNKDQPWKKKISGEVVRRDTTTLSRASGRVQSDS